MLLWLSLYYLAPALLCDRLVRLLAKRIGSDHNRKWLVVIGFTLSWTPLIMTAYDRTGPVQLLLAIALFKKEELITTPWWQQAMLLITVSVLAWYVVFKRRQPALPPIK